MKNKGIIITVLTILVIGYLSVKVSYSAFSVDSTKHNILNFGAINLQLCYKDDCKSPLISNTLGTKHYIANGNEYTTYVEYKPINDPDFSNNKTLENLEYYTVNIANKEDKDLYVTLYLDVNNSNDLSYTVENNNKNSFVKKEQYKYYKVAIREENTVTPYITTYDEIFNNDGKLIDNISLNANQTKKYYVYIWKSREELAKWKMANVDGKFFLTEVYTKGEYK